MRKSITSLCAGMGILLLLAPNAFAATKEEKISPDNVPKAVMKTINARFNGAHVTGAAKELDDQDWPVYEVSFDLEDQTFDVILTPRGEIRLIEKKITVEGLPEAVARAVMNKYPKATYKLVEELTTVKKKKEKLAFYEVLIETADKKELEVKLTPEGKIVEETPAGE